MFAGHLFDLVVVDSAFGCGFVSDEIVKLCHVSDGVAVCEVSAV